MVHISVPGSISQKNCVRCDGWAALRTDREGHRYVPAFLWHPDSECETGYRRGKTVVINGGGAYADIYCNSLNVRKTKEFTWEGIINSMSPVTFIEEGDGQDAE